MNLNRIWRLIATGLGFAIFGLFGVLFKIVLLPYTLKSSQGDLERQKKARRLVGKSWYWFTRYLEKSGILEAEFQGFERLGQPGQLILANHPSLLDVVFLLSRVPDANCIVKAGLQTNPAMSSQIRACGYIPNSEDLEFVEKIHDTLRHECLLVFPEGTRTGWDGEVKFHRGAVSMGLRSARIITPVSIHMQPPNFKKGQPWYKIPAQKVRYRFIVGEDIRPADWLAEKPLPIAARRLNDHLQQYFNENTR
ncbi:MAG: lysophospholipid acyltransferase family protein [Cardiobacteriaceae bacterium]|nr:lysophospholipid acyltransferase family protein [Cardiobacteriaceae bacterium]